MQQQGSRTRWLPQAAAGERWLYLLVNGDALKDEILGEARLERPDFEDGVDAEGGGTDDWE